MLLSLQPFPTPQTPRTWIFKNNQFLLTPSSRPTSEIFYFPCFLVLPLLCDFSLVWCYSQCFQLKFCELNSWLFRNAPARVRYPWQQQPDTQNTTLALKTRSGQVHIANEI